MLINIATYISEEENEVSCRVRVMCLTPHSTIFRYIVAVRGNRSTRRKPPTCRKHTRLNGIRTNNVSGDMAPIAYVVINPIRSGIV